MQWENPIDGLPNKLAETSHENRGLDLLYSYDEGNKHLNLKNSNNKSKNLAKEDLESYITKVSMHNKYMDFFKYVNFALPTEKITQPNPNTYYCVDGFTPRLYLDIMHSSGIPETKYYDEATVIVGSSKGPPLQNILMPNQRIERFLRTFKIGSKIGLHASLTIYRQHTRKNLPFYPQTYLIPEEMDSFKKHFTDHEIWIVKPTGGSCGRGIFLINEMPEKFNEQYIVQQYISNPMLVHGLKFDLRFYVAMTSLNPLRLYIYRDGLVRLATSDYKNCQNDLQNLSAHLTNFTYNKDKPGYKYTDDLKFDGEGNKWSHDPLWPFLRQRGYDTDKIRKNTEIAIVTAFIASRPYFFDQKYPRVSTELYGVDMILDDKGNVFMEEVNVAPALGTKSKLDIKIKAPLLTDFLNLSLIPERTELSNSLEVLMESNKKLSEYVICREFEEAERRLGGWHRIYPTMETVSIEMPSETHFDRVLRRWIAMNYAGKLKYLKDRESNLSSVLSMVEYVTTPCTIC